MDAGTSINSYQANVVGGKKNNYIFLHYGNQTFQAIPVSNTYSFKKQIVNVNNSVFEKLHNLSEDPDYAKKMAKEKKKQK